MTIRESGRVLSVQTNPLGSSVAADAVSGASTVLVDDTSDFDQRGQVTIAGTLYDYVLAVDADDAAPGELTLTPLLAADAETDEPVVLWDDVTAAPAVEVVANVLTSLDDELPCVVNRNLVDQLDEGDRGRRGETVLVEDFDGDGDWHVIDVLAAAKVDRTKKRMKVEPAHIVTSTTTQVFDLPKKPISDQYVVLRLHRGGPNYEGLELSLTAWTLSGSTLTVTDAFDVGDSFSAEFWFNDGFTVQSEALSIPYGSPGWSYLQINDDPETNTEDYSDPDYDDSAWLTGTAPFGDFTFRDLAPATVWDKDLAPICWLRRTFAPSFTATVYVNIEDNCKMWVNGELVLSLPEYGSGSHDEQVVDISSALFSDRDNVIAVRACDEVPKLGGGVYVDVSVEAEARVSPPGLSVPTPGYW